MKKKRRIYIFLILFILVSLFFFYFITKKNNKNVNHETLIYTQEHGGMYGATTSDGVFYVYIQNNGYMDYFIRFIDYKTGQDIAVCNKPECSHDTRDCNAFLCRSSPPDENRMAFDLFTCNNKLYVTIREGDDTVAGTSSMSLYEQDFDGENRRKLFTLEQELFQQIITTGHTIIFSTLYIDKSFMKQFEGKDMSQITDEEFSEIDKHNCRSLWSYNTETGKLLMLQESFGAREKELSMESIVMSDDKQGFYYVSDFVNESGENSQLWYYYDIASNTYKEIMTGFSDCNLFADRRIYNEKLYYRDKISHAFCSYDINTGTITKLADISNCIDSFKIDDKLFWNLDYGEGTDYSKKYQRWVYFDYKTEEFYVAKEGGHYPVYSSGEKGIVDYTDYYNINNFQWENKIYDYKIMDMDNYYKANYKKYENEYADALIIEN